MKHVIHSRRVVLTLVIGSSAECAYKVIIGTRVKTVNLKSGSVPSVLVCAGAPGVYVKII
jgi:hypothetical protein